MLAQAIEAGIGPTQAEPRGYDPRYFVEDKIPEAVKTHPLGPLFDINRLWGTPNTINFSGVKVEIDILDRIPFRGKNPYFLTVATFMRGLNPFGMFIDGVTGPETIALARIWTSPNIPGEIDITLERLNADIQKELSNHGFETRRLSGKSPLIAAYYSSENQERVRPFYHGSASNYSRPQQTSQLAA